MGTIVLLAGMNALVTGIITAVIAFFFSTSKRSVVSGETVAKLFVATSIATFAVTFVGFYFAMPAFIGGLFGGLGFVVCGMLSAPLGAAIAAAWISHDDKESALVGTLYPVVALVLIVGSLLFNQAGMWFGGTAHDLAHIVRVVQHSKQDSLPQTDEKHLVLVTPEIAYNLAQSSIGNDGRNLGSSYQTNQDEYTLQSIRGHLYYIAPLNYRNMFIQWGTYETPGYVRVDAEDPYAQPVFVTDKPLHYTTKAQFGTDVTRHVYEAGYTRCNLLDPTLEVDDSDNPWYTIACAGLQHSYAGDLIQSVLLVNSDTGEIHAYGPQDVPAWVDRVYPEQTISDYMDWWGKYLNGPGLNPSGQGQSVVASGTTADDDTSNDNSTTLQILYSKADNEPVYVVPMTSSNGNDNSSNGIALCHTRMNQCDFYPLYGYGVDTAIKTVFDNAALPGVTASGAKPKHSIPQLVNLYGVLSWVTTYETDAANGSSFWGVGIVDARPGHLNASNVVVAKTPADALSAYQDYLATAPTSGQPTAQGGDKHFTASILQVQPVVQNGKTLYAFIFKGDKHVYYADSAISRFLPFMQAGDAVTITYNDTGLDTLNIKSITDQRLAALVG